MSKVDDENSGVVEEDNILERGGIDTDERAGQSQGIDPHSEPDDETKKEMDEEREQRLDPDNRPDNAEIDNSDRDFDTSKGMFEDNENYDEAEPVFSDPEDPNNPDNKDDSEDSGENDDSEDSAESNESEGDDKDA